MSSQNPAALNTLDRILSFLAPGVAVSRQKARVQSHLLARHYEAASGGRRTSGWRATGSDATAAMRDALARLRNNARDLVRNNPHATSALDIIADHVVGWGIVAKPGDGNQRVAETWDRWASTPACDADGRLDFYGLQKLAQRTITESGEVLVRQRYRRQGDTDALGRPLPVPLQIQVLEPDYIDTLKTGLTLPNGGRIVAGIEYDALGRRVAYWLFPEHPGSEIFGGATTSRRIPAGGILHVFRTLRPGQGRGASWFSSVILKMRDFDEYDDAQLMKQKVAALLGVVVTDIDGTARPFGSTDSSQPSWDYLEPGGIHHVGPGTKVDIIDPPRVAEFADYSAVTLRTIAAGLGIGYEDLTGDYCVAPETRVLRADLRWVRADELAAGDAIVGFDEGKPGGRGNRRKYRTAEVVRSDTRTLNRRRVVTESASVVVSDEHLFLCTSKQGQARVVRGAGIQARSESPGAPGPGQRWVRADRLSAGDRILFLVAPWLDGATHAHGYLKGMADGEGCIQAENAVISIAQNAGPVFEETGQILRALGFQATRKKANGKGKVLDWSMQGIGNCLRFLGEVRPTRLLLKAESVYAGRMIAGGSKKAGAATSSVVLSVEDIGPGQVVTLETSTRTLITEGLLSHNSRVNFSSARMARIRHWARVEDWRWQTLIPQFCAPIWSWVMQAAAVVGKAPAEVVPAVWTAPPPPMLDPASEATAYRDLVRGGFLSWSEAMRERGYDPKAALVEITTDFKAIEAAGIVLDSNPKQVSAAGLTQSVDPTAPKPAPGDGSRALPPPSDEEGDDPEEDDAKEDEAKEDRARLIAAMERQTEATMALARRPIPAPVVTFERGSIAVDARTTIEPGAVTVDARTTTTIEPGAVLVETNVGGAPSGREMLEAVAENETLPEDDSLTPRQREVFGQVRDLVREHKARLGEAPSLALLARAMKLDRKTLREHLQVLYERGEIKSPTPGGVQ